MRFVGTVVFVQIQRSHMKTGEGIQRVYHPAPLLQVARLQLTLDGVFGITESGEAIIDVHHAQHPQTRYRGDNRISFGFLHHYAAIRERFGSHLYDGIAGENMLIDASSQPVEFRAGQRVFIRSAEDEALTELIEVIPAPPCREFSQFCAQAPLAGQDLKAALQFLDHGKRGYYAELASPDSACFVQPGDTLWLA